MVMYQEHFGLSRAPFSMHPDPAFLYLSEQHSSAKAFLESSALVNDSFVVITGSVGAGKTTLVEAFANELSVNSTVIARINQTQLSATGFLRLLLDDLGLKAFKAKKPQLLSRLSEFLGTCEREGKRVVVVVDEAQNLSREVLEEIRLLTGSQHAGCLSVVLVGQPEFLQILESPNLRQLAQRCRLRSHLIALDEMETQEYVAHRLAVAGAENEHLFSESAVELVFEKTGGVPRLINNLCDTALICAFADGLTEIDESVVNAALKELKWQPATQKTNSAKTASPGKNLASSQRVPKYRSNKGRAKPSQKDEETQKLIGRKDARISELEQALELAQKEMDANGEQLKQADLEISSLQKTTSESAAETENQDQQLIASQQRLGELLEHIELFLDAHVDETTDGVDADAETLHEHFEQLNSSLSETENLLDIIEQAGANDQQAVVAGDEKMADLHEQLTAGKSEQERLQTEVDKLKDKEELVTELEEKLARANSDLAALQVAKEDLGGNIEQSNEDLEREKSRVTKLLSELEAEAGNLSALKLEKEEIGGELRNATAELEDARRRLAEAASSLEAKNEEISALNKTENDSSAELEDARRKLAESGNSLEAKNEEISALNKTENDLSAELEDTRRRLAESGNSLEAKNEEISALSKTEHDLSAELEDTRRRLAESGNSLEAKNEEISALSKTENDLSAELKNTRVELENSRSELAASQERVSELEESKEKSAARVVRLDEKVDSRDHSIRTLEAEVRRKNKLIDELHDQLKPLPEMSSQIETLIAENSELRNDLDSKAHRVVELEEALSLSQQRLDDARQEIDSSHNQHVDLHKEIAEHKSQVSELEKGTSQRDDLVKSLHVECQNRKQDLRRLRSELDDSLDQARELRDSVKIGEDRARELEAEFQAAMETIREMNEAGYEASTEAREVSVELTEREKQIDSLEAQLQDKEATLLSMATSLKEKTETIKVLELDSEASGEHRQSGVDAADAAAHDQLVKQLKREIEARDSCIEDLEASLSTSSDNLAQFTVRMEQQDSRINELEEQLESSRMAAAELREEVGRTDREFDETSVLQEESTESNGMSMRLQTLGAGLLVSTNGHPARRVALRSERLIIGRTRDSDIKIDNEFASRHHAQIVYDKGKFFVEDLNSTNGIYVNSRRVKRRRLRNRDIISIGRDRLIFVVEQQASH